jgi:hypothetical protein
MPPDQCPVSPTMRCRGSPGQPDRIRRGIPYPPDVFGESGGILLRAQSVTRSHQARLQPRLLALLPSRSDQPSSRFVPSSLLAISFSPREKWEEAGVVASWGDIKREELHQGSGVRRDASFVAAELLSDTNESKSRTRSKKILRSEKFLISRF